MHAGTCMHVCSYSRWEYSSEVICVKGQLHEQPVALARSGTISGSGCLCSRASARAGALIPGGGSWGQKWRQVWGCVHI